MKEEDLREGEWYKITGDGFTDEDYICFHDKHNYSYSYTQCVDGGNFEHRSGHWVGVEIEYVSPMTEAQKVEYLPQYKPRGLGWCRTEVKGYYIFVIGLNTYSVTYAELIDDGEYSKLGSANSWATESSFFACPLTEDEIEEFITPYLPKDSGLHVPEENFIYDQSNIDYAKKSYPPGTVVWHMYAANEWFRIEEDTVFTEDVDGSIFIQYEDIRLWLFEGGVWADIVTDEPTETDLEKAKRLYPIGTKYISPENGKTYYVEKAPYGDQYWINAKGDICADTGVNEGEFIFYQGKWAEIIEPQKLDMTGLPDAHIENLHNSVKEFLVDTTSVASYDQSRFVPVGEPYMGYLSDSQKAGLKGQQRVPTMLGGKGVINVDELRAQAKEMNLLPIDIERVVGMHNPPISLYDGLNWMLPSDKKRGSEIIEIFIKK